MRKECENRYKICRNTAGLTQEQAAELLHITTRTLSDYENSRAKVPDDVVAFMTECYNAPLLAWWHLKETSILGEFLPEIIMPQTNGDMAFQLVLAEGELACVVKEIKKIMSNGKIDEGERENFNTSMELIKQINAKLFSIIVYGEQISKKRKEEFKCHHN